MKNQLNFDEQGLYDIFDHWNKPFWQTKYFQIGVITLIILLLSILFFLFFFYRMRKKSVAHQALANLKLLQKNATEFEKDLQSHYYELTGIFKYYLHYYFESTCKSMTDSEILDHLKNKQIAQERILFLEKILATSENIKYAQQTAQKDIFLTHVQYVIETITDLEKKKKSNE